MALWKHWLRWVRPLRPVCARNRTFLWMCVILMGFCVRENLFGVTSFVRALGLDAMFYDRLLDFFHSPALDVGRLRARDLLWRPVGIRIRFVAAAPRNTLPDFLADEPADPILAKFPRDRLDATQSAAARLAA